MDQQMNVEQVRESLFGDKMAYIVLYEAAGEEGAHRIADIEKRGAKAVMESLLQSPTLTVTPPVAEKPWSMFNHLYALGDYTLVWSYRDVTVKLVETTDPEDPYSNESVKPLVSRLSESIVVTPNVKDTNRLSIFDGPVMIGTALIALTHELVPEIYELNQKFLRDSMLLKSIEIDTEFHSNGRDVKYMKDSLGAICEFARKKKYDSVVISANGVKNWSASEYSIATALQDNGFSGMPKKEKDSAVYLFKKL